MNKFFIFISLSWFSLDFSQAPYPAEDVVVDTVLVEKKDNWLDTDSILAHNYETDNSIYAKHFDSKYKSKYQSQDFNYDITKPKPSLWDKIKRRLEKWLSSLFGEPDPAKASRYAENIIRGIGLIIIGALLYFLITFLLRKEGNFWFSKKNKKLKIDAEDLLENIHEINFQQRIIENEQQGHYRNAIRYQFLFILKQLTDKKMIDWNPEKTNKDYIKELSNPFQKEQFRKMAYIYDYVWYGEFDIQKSDYDQFKNKFKAL